MQNTEYFISTESARLDLELIHQFLSEHSYWARGIPRDVVARSIANSLCPIASCNVTTQTCMGVQGRREARALERCLPCEAVVSAGGSVEWSCPVQCSIVR
jgi:hypothetical protein